jgi:hypothetical protein
VRTSHICLEIYDAYAKYFNPDYTDVVVKNETWSIPSISMPASPSWIVAHDGDNTNITRSYGILNVTYALMAGSWLKLEITFQNPLTSTLTFNFKYSLENIVFDSKSTNGNNVNLLNNKSLVMQVKFQSGNESVKSIDSNTKSIGATYGDYVLVRNGIITIDPTVSTFNSSTSDGYLYNAGHDYQVQHDETSGIVSFTNNAWLGQRYVGTTLLTTLRPNTNGDLLEWTRSDVSKTHAQLLNDSDDTTYVYTASAGKYDLVNVPDISTTPITSVSVFCRVKCSAHATLNIIRITLKTHSWTYTSAKKSCYTTWVTCNNVWATNPNTSLPWTLAEVNAMQIGVYDSDLITGDEIDCSEVYSKISTASYEIYRSAWFVDTSSLAGATVTACNVSLYIPAGYDQSTTDFTMMVEKNSSYARPTDPLVSTDYDYRWYAWAGYGYFYTSSITTLDQYYNISIGSMYLTNFLNLTGTTKFMLFSGQDFNSVAPTTDEYIRYYTGSASNYKACLVVTCAVTVNIVDLTLNVKYTFTDARQTAFHDVLTFSSNYSFTEGIQSTFHNVLVFAINATFENAASANYQRVLNFTATIILNMGIPQVAYHIILRFSPTFKFAWSIPSEVVERMPLIVPYLLLAAVVLAAIVFVMFWQQEGKNQEQGKNI